MWLRDLLTLSSCAALGALLLAASSARALPIPSGVDGGCTASCPLYWSGNGHYYAFVDTGAAPPTWTQARDDAAHLSLGAGLRGHLATLSDAGENAFVASQVLPLGFSHKRQVWLGGFQNDTPVKSLPPDVGWQWISPESWIYQNWTPGEPNDETPTHSGDERYLTMWVHFYVSSAAIDHRGEWNDEGLASQTQAPIVGYIVEYEAVPEPAAALLALLGFGALARRARR